MKNAMDQMDHKRLYILLMLLLVSALGLRLWGIWFGLPYSYNADEYHEVFRALELGSGGFNLERTGKGGYFYVLFVEYGILFVTFKLIGIVGSAQEFAQYFFRDPSNFYLIGRSTTAVVGTLNVYLVYRLGARAYSIGAGLLAAVFIAVDFLNVRHSHFITVDIPMACLATAALLFAIKMATNGRASDYKWAALFAALATTTKLPAILLLGPLLIAHWYFVKGQGGSVRSLFISRNIWWAAGIFVVALAVTNPGIFVNPPVGVMLGDAEGADIDLGEEALADIPRSVQPNLFAFYFVVLADSMGWPLLIVSLIGLLFAIWKRTPADVILVSFGVINFVAFSSTSSHLFYPRYMLPVIIVLTLLAGRTLYFLWPRQGAIKQGAAVAVVLAVVVVPTFNTIKSNILFTYPDTRTIAKEWFEENVPDGSKVLIEGLTIEPTRLTIPLHNSTENLREMLEYYRATNDRGKVKYLEFKLKVVPERTYDLEFVKRAELDSFSDYKNTGVEYLIIRPAAFVDRKAGAAGGAFLDALQNDPDVSLISRFRFDPKLRTGPDIDVYRIDSNANSSEVSLLPTDRVNVQE